MDFPTIHTNVWDVLLAIPSINILTQASKILFHIPSKYIPALALVLGLIISIFISHPHNLVAGLFMGWFYGYAAIGNYAALKTAIINYRKKE